MIFRSGIGVSAIENSQSKGLKQKMRERKLRRDVNWQWTFRQKGVKQWLVVYYYLIISC
jgi:hypothetical protein